MVPQAVAFALLSLFFAGCIDVLYKRYARKQRSRGIFLLLTGLVWIALQLASLALTGRALVFDGATLIYGALAGLALSLANILLLESLAHLDVSQGSTIYRLNTIGVVLLSTLFLGESLGALKAAGVLCGIASVLVLYRDRTAVRPGTAASELRLYLGVAIAASLCRALYGVFSKAGLSLGGDATTMILISALCWMASGLGYAWLREGQVRFTWVKLRYAAAAGILVFLIVNTLIAAIARGEVSVVVPIANLSFVVALVISVTCRMELVTKHKLAAILFAVLAIALLGQVA